MSFEFVPSSAKRLTALLRTRPAVSADAAPATQRNRHCPEKTRYTHRGKYRGKFHSDCRCTCRGKGRSDFRSTFRGRYLGNDRSRAAVEADTSIQARAVTSPAEQAVASFAASVTAVLREVLR